MNAAAAMQIPIVRDPVAKQLRTIIDAHGDSWGFQWRHNFGDLVRIEVPSLLGKFLTEGFAAADGQNKPRRYPEVFMGMGLDFARALRTVTDRRGAESEHHREMAFAHYVLVNVHVTRKATALGLEKSGYYWRLDSMRAALAPLLLGDGDVELLD